jgi:hypothetical protein
MSDEDTQKSSGSGWGFGVLLMFLLGAGIALVLPNFVRPRVTIAHGACISSLKQIDGAVQQWALEKKKTATDTYSLSDSTLLAYFKGSVLPMCYKGGRYSPGKSIADSPKCSIGGIGHTL